MPDSTPATGVSAWVTLKRDGVRYALVLATSGAMTIHRQRPSGQWHEVDRGVPITRSTGRVDIFWDGSAFVTVQTRYALRRRLLEAQRRGDVQTGVAPWSASA